MDMDGWVRLHRILLTKTIWKKSNPIQKCILITILLMANYRSNEWFWKGKKFTCKEGEFISSIAKIASTADKSISYQNVRTALSRFKNKFNFLEYETSRDKEDGIKITVLNWSEYQTDPIDEPQPEQKPPEEPKKQKQTKETKKFIPPTIEEIKAYCESRHNNVDAKRFFDYYNEGNWKDSNGKPLKNWKQKIIAVWEKKNKQNKVVQIPKKSNDDFYMSLSR